MARLLLSAACHSFPWFKILSRCHTHKCVSSPVLPKLQMHFSLVKSYLQASQPVIIKPSNLVSQLLYQSPQSNLFLNLHQQTSLHARYHICPSHFICCLFSFKIHNFYPGVYSSVCPTSEPLYFRTCLSSFHMLVDYTQTKP